MELHFKSDLNKEKKTLSPNLHLISFTKKIPKKKHNLTNYTKLNGH